MPYLSTEQDPFAGMSPIRDRTTVISRKDNSNRRRKKLTTTSNTDIDTPSISATFLDNNILVSSVSTPNIHSTININKTPEKLSGCNTEFEWDGDVKMKSPNFIPKVMRYQVERNPFSPKFRSNAVAITLGPEYANETEKLAHQAKMAEKRRQIEKNMAERRSARITTTKAPQRLTRPSKISVFEDKENIRPTTHEVKFHIGCDKEEKLFQARTARANLKAAANLTHTTNISQYIADARSRQAARFFSLQNNWL